MSNLSYEWRNLDQSQIKVWIKNRAEGFKMKSNIDLGYAIRDIHETRLLKKALTSIWNYFEALGYGVSAGIYTNEFIEGEFERIISMINEQLEGPVEAIETYITDALENGIQEASKIL